MSKRHIHQARTGSYNLLPKDGEQRRMCRNNAGTCSPSLGFESEPIAREDAELRYLASILVDIFLDELKEKAKTAKGSEGP